MISHVSQSTQKRQKLSSSIGYLLSLHSKCVCKFFVGDWNLYRSRYILCAI